MGILEDIDLAAFARETADRAAAGGENVRRTEMVRCAWLMLELLDVIERAQERERELAKEVRKMTKQLPAPEVAAAARASGGLAPLFDARPPRQDVFLIDGLFTGATVQVSLGTESAWFAKRPHGIVQTDRSEDGAQGYYRSPDKPAHEGLPVFEMQF